MNYAVENIKQSFVYTQLNDQTVLFLTIQFNISHLFTQSLNVKQFCFTLSGTNTKVRVDLGAMAMTGTPCSPKLQYYDKVL